MFSLVGCLPSMPSVGGSPPVFGHFDGSTQPSDSPPTCMLDFWLMAFSDRPAANCTMDVDGVSGSRARSFHAFQGSQTARSPADARDIATPHPPCWLPAIRNPLLLTTDLVVW